MQSYYKSTDFFKKRREISGMIRKAMINNQNEVRYCLNGASRSEINSLINFYSHFLNAYYDPYNGNLVIMPKKELRRA